MVIFEPEERSEQFVKYKYYPEGDKDKKPGIIKLDLIADTIDVIVSAEGDRIRHAPADELNNLRNSINQMRRERGKQELSEEELPIATENEEWYWYADHAIRKIAEAYRKGEILEKGSSAWY